MDFGCEDIWDLIHHVLTMNMNAMNSMLAENL